mmetsp:Transcript_54353/g.131028  ORF Transcript_54353/g.131028 Transcript_54353/m.131028 type:complete len:80 (-) Transcript_54353:363-602(-)
MLMVAGTTDVSVWLRLRSSPLQAPKKMGPRYRYLSHRTQPVVQVKARTRMQVVITGVVAKMQRRSWEIGMVIIVGLTGA